MKQIIITLTLIIAGSAACFAQCGKTSVLNSSKTYMCNKDGNVVNTMDENAQVTFNDKTIDIVHGSDPTLHGTIKNFTCDWKTPYKEGKTTINALFTSDNGEEKNAAVTIESKDGKIILTFLADGDENRVQVTADSFKEKS